MTIQSNHKTFTINEIASICDHTFLLRSEQYKDKVLPGQSCAQLREKDFWSFMEETIALPCRPYGICIRPEDCIHADYFLRSKKFIDNFQLVSVVGFPDGAWVPTGLKLAEAEFALANGASEIDMVLSVSALKSRNSRAVEADVLPLVKACHEKNAILKLIFEIGVLNEDEQRLACQIAEFCGADFIKTSSGFSGVGATEEALILMRKHFSRGIKISGGVSGSNVNQFLHILKVTELDPRKIRIGESSLLGGAVG